MDEPSLPSRVEIRALPAGHTTDTLVARWVLGRDPAGGAAAEEAAIPPYSTDTPTARQLLKDASARWPLGAYQFATAQACERVVVHIDNVVEHGVAPIADVGAETEALAICRALLFTSTLDPWDRYPPIG
jgi:hypothetical protein